MYYQENEDIVGHECIIEIEILTKKLELFKKILDKGLREVNSDYDAKRYKDMALAAPTIHIAPNGTFYKWLKSKGKLGGQNKVPRLSNDRTYLKAILPFIKT